MTGGMLYRLRKSVYEFSRDFIKPDPPIRSEVPEVGHVAFDEASTYGTYSGDVVMPADTELTDATAFSLVMSALWMIDRAPERGMHGRLSHEGFRHHIRWSVEFEPLDDLIKDTVIPMDPAGIKNLIHSMIESAEYETDDPYEEPEPEPPIDMESARNRFRTLAPKDAEELQPE
jgi:hypothetical protein